MTEQQWIKLVESSTPPERAPVRQDIECGCRVEVDPDGPVWSIVQCPRHAAESAQVEERIGRALDYELDVLVAATCQGRRVKRIMPADPFRKP